MTTTRGVLISVLLLLETFAPRAFSSEPELPSAKPGQITYVDFWASWCAPCAESFPWLNRMQEKFGSRGLQVVGVGVDTDDSMSSRFLQAHPARFPVVRDAEGRLAERLGVEGMPYSIIVDADGTVLHRHAGFVADRAGEYERAIEAALAARGMQK